ncbi:MAG: 3'-5' exonuclease [Planctomycetota bacterium]
MDQNVTHFIFDVESVADGKLVSSVRYPGQNLDPKQAIATYQDELSELNGTTFIPYTFQLPVAVVIAKVLDDYSLGDIVSLDEGEFRPHVITDLFWRGWEAYKHPTWVTFNGRSFDLPIMELAAFRYGVAIPSWFDSDGYRSKRNRFNTDSHLDLQDAITNFGASRCNGGLNLIAKLLNKPGKIDTRGEEVQAMYDEGQLGEISEYCRCDVLDTYFVFLRTMTLRGKISLDRETELVAQTKAWIEERAEESQAYRDYLAHWSEWVDPRKEAQPV